ncbi:MAG: GCN5-related N-acetyltransferase [Polaromonas sp.]|nr:GCN5-related N-acetyltransferase [Polaromonas sp.]
MHIRRLQPSDAPLYRAFRLRGLREHPDAFTSGFEEENRRPLLDSEKRLASAGAEKLWGGFSADGALAGMVGLSHETRAHNRHKATLVGLYVAAEFTGQGLGRALVQTAVQDARASGVELLVLTVTKGNRRAGSLYDDAGFAVFGLEPDAIRVNGVSFDKQHLYLQLSPG